MLKPFYKKNPEKKIIKSLCWLVVIFSLFITFNFVLETQAEENVQLAVKYGVGTGDSTQKKGLSPKSIGLEYGMYSGLSSSDLRLRIASIIRMVLGLTGTVALVIVIYAGFIWMIAGGNEERAEQAKKWLYSGVIGLAIILSAYTITYFVIRNLVSSTTGDIERVYSGGEWSTK